ncbi:T9SS type A sorting domain-containing protein (plasmid) [Pedobacter sp. BS3]|uniref:T9SS type A sorting domain-containing protein n=1 Tax=Pedobacter sp. BS3 TaxID=2567937 RepID=UPI0011ECCDF1|nr:T9SS type A sorting domain-containing protein [Pedobacter sp. BS3]TZF86026.1 T9SS type A sorting domain-containing protein [Pedobacter sp. BS3]
MKKLLVISLLVTMMYRLDAQIIITGFLVEPPGTDAPAGGGYEYIQLRATQDIDFAATPYAVVAGEISGGTPSALGWAAGASLTYKFNLTSGTVNKGDYFYVGNTKKLINGAGSTGISSAKWIRVKSTGDETGDDGMGVNATAGFLPQAKNSACGIAVFSGTLIDGTTVPLDAVFYGDNIGNAYITSSGNGYLVPKNDLYDPDPGQPKFGMGSNTILIGPKATTDDNHFYMLGGVYNLTTNHWDAPRSATLITLSSTSTLADIESGTGANILPIKLTSFTAQKQQNAVRLSWSTASETNNSHFEVLRSDGEAFQAIGMVQGNGTTSEMNTYNFTDNNPLPGISYYQLRQVDFNGKSELSKIIPVNIEFSQPQIRATGRSNTQHIEISVYSPQAGRGKLQVTDVNGKKIATQNISLEKGNNQYTIPANLSAGVYIATAAIAGKKYAVKFMPQ